MNTKELPHFLLRARNWSEGKLLRSMGFRKEGAKAVYKDSQSTGRGKADDAAGT